MNYLKQKLVPVSYFIGTAGIVAGAVLKIMHYPFAGVVLGLGLIGTLVFIISALVEIYTSARIQPSTKKMYTLGLILSGTLVGLVYVLRRSPQAV